jgi:hypothetical protein
MYPACLHASLLSSLIRLLKSHNTTPRQPTHVYLIVHINTANPTSARCTNRPSVAGHYIPAFGAFIHDQNTNNKSQPAINFKGVSIGDGWTDPIHQMGAIPGLMYNTGLTDDAQNLVGEVECRMCSVAL